MRELTSGVDILKVQKIFSIFIWKEGYLSREISRDKRQISIFEYILWKKRFFICRALSYAISTGKSLKKHIVYAGKLDFRNLMIELWDSVQTWVMDHMNGPSGPWTRHWTLRAFRLVKATVLVLVFSISIYHQYLVLVYSICIWYLYLVLVLSIGT